jgi:hypothetical protein
MTMNDDLANYFAIIKEHYKSHPEDARFVSQFLFRCYYWCDDLVDLRNKIKTFHKEILNAHQIDYEETDKELIATYQGDSLLHPWNCTRYGDFYDEQYIEKYKSRFSNLKSKKIN